MLRVKDEYGNIVQGLYKDQRGAIVVEKNSDYDRYLREKKHQETINNLQNEVSELRNAIQDLMSIINKTESKGQ